MYQLPHLTTCGRETALSLCRNLRQFPLPNSLCVTWLRQHKTWTACSTFDTKSRAASLGMVGRGRCHQRSKESTAYRQSVVTLLQWLERNNISSPQVPSSSCRPEQDVKFASEAVSEGHRSSTRATSASPKSAGCMGCVHQVCRPQNRSPEGTNASFASVDGG